MRALGCVNSHPAARGSQKAGFTQPRAHNIAQLCTLHYSMKLSMFSDKEALQATDSRRGETRALQS